MDGSYDPKLEELYAEYERQRTALGDMHRRMREMSAAAVSPRREVEVTVGAHGVVLDVRFPTSAYRRMAPKELAAVLLETIAAAREKATDLTAEIIAPNMPDGIDARAMLAGTASFEPLLPEVPRTHPLVREHLNRGA